MPLRLSELRKRFGKFGVEFADDGTKHPYRFTRDGYSVFPLKAHNGLKSQISDLYIDRLCRHFG